MNNRTIIEKKLESIGFTIGTYDTTIDKLSKKELSKVIDNLEYGSTDIGVKIRSKEYVVEVFHVDDEMDFKMTSPETYANIYGREFGEE